MINGALRARRVPCRSMHSSDSSRKEIICWPLIMAATPGICLLFDRIVV